jgi:hypothetical protein
VSAGAAGQQAAPRPEPARRLARTEILLALAAFAVLCIAVLSAAPQLVEPDDYAYRASIVALTDGYPATLSTAQVSALATQLTQSAGTGRAVLTGPGPLGGSIIQWIEISPGRWISEKDPGYPFLAVPFQLLGIIRLAPLFYGALGCLGLFFGARRWLGRYAGTVAIGFFCSCGAALLFAWRDYMPTFTDASLIAAGTGALLWALLAGEATASRRTWTGLLAFLAIEAAVFARYTNAVVLGCAVITVLAVRWRRPASVPRGALAVWLGSVALFGAGVAVFDDLVYGGPLKSGYQPGEITFSLSAVLPNFRYMPGHLLQAMPMLMLGLAGLVWIAARRAGAGAEWGWARSAGVGRAERGGGKDRALRRAGGEQAVIARRDLAVGIALAASWFGVWALYATYTWTAAPGLSTLQAARFYVPAIGAISLLATWLVIHASRLAAASPLAHALGRARMPGRASVAAMTSAAVVAAMFGLGLWSFSDMRAFRLPTRLPPPHCNIGQPGCPVKGPSGPRAAPAGGHRAPQASVP